MNETIIKLSVRGQRLVCNAPDDLVSDSIHYQDVLVDFSHESAAAWRGLNVWLHLRNEAGEVYDVELADCWAKGLSLSAGLWTIWLHGTDMTDGMPVIRITSDCANFWVKRYADERPGPVPAVPLTAAEKVEANAAWAKEQTKQLLDDMNGLVKAAAETQTAKDAALEAVQQTAADRQATGTDAKATAADREASSQNAQATSSDRQAVAADLADAKTAVQAATQQAERAELQAVAAAQQANCAKSEAVKAAGTVEDKLGPVRTELRQLSLQKADKDGKWELIDAGETQEDAVFDFNKYPDGKTYNMSKCRVYFEFPVPYAGKISAFVFGKIGGGYMSFEVCNLKAYQYQIFDFRNDNEGCGYTVSAASNDKNRDAKITGYCSSSYKFFTNVGRLFTTGPIPAKTKFEIWGVKE